MENNNEKTAEQWQAEITAAEERGYQRGINEQLATRMAEPGQWESSNSTPAEFQILGKMTTSIWDK